MRGAVMSQGQYKRSSNLLVSCPNAGGLVAIFKNETIFLDKRDTTGIFAANGKLFRGLQSGPHRAVIYGQHEPITIDPAVSMDDIHDILVLGKKAYFVATGTNEVVETTLNGAETRRWRFPGETDAWHINCLGVLAGRIIGSAFGQFRESRGYKGQTDGKGFVFDLFTGEKLVEGLSQPHSLVSSAEGLLVANSEKCELLLAKNGKIKKRMMFEGYTRGLAIDEKYIYLGLSRSRNISEGDLSLGTAKIIWLDRKTWIRRGEINLPSNEIYDIRVVSSNSAMGQLINRISSYEKMQQVQELHQDVAVVRAVASQRETELTQARGELVQQSALVQQMETEIQSLREQVVQWQSEVAGCDERIKGKEDELAQLRVDAVLRAERVIALEAAHQQMHGELIQAQVSLSERDQQIQRLDQEVVMVRAMVSQRETELTQTRGELVQQNALVQQMEMQVQQLESQLGQSQVLVGERDQQIVRLQAEIQALNLTKAGYEQTREQLVQSQQRLAERDEQNQGLASELVYSRNELELRNARMQRFEAQAQQLQSQLGQSEAVVGELGQKIEVLEAALAAVQGLIALRSTQLTALLQDLAQKDTKLSILETKAQRGAAALKEQKCNLHDLDTRLSEALRQLSATQAGVHERNEVIERLTKTLEDREHRLREMGVCLTDAQAESTSLRTSLRERDLQNSSTLTAMGEKVKVLRAELARLADAEQQRALQLEKDIKTRFPAEEINTFPVDAVIQSINENVEVGVEGVLSMRAAYGNVVAIGDHTSVMAAATGAGISEQTTLRRPLFVASNNSSGHSELVAVQTEIDRARAELVRAGANCAKNEAGSVISLRLLDKQAAELEKLHCENELESKRLAVVDEWVRERELEAALLAQKVAEQENKLACLDKWIAERDSQIAELTDETIRRGIWALGLDQQLKDTQAKIAQITSSNSWKVTLPMREMRRWLTSPTSQAKRYLSSTAKLARNAYARLPISQKTRISHWHFLSKHAPWALRRPVRHPLTESTLQMPVAVLRPAQSQMIGQTHISLACSTQPVVSVIIPIYGKCDYTLRCLSSIAANLPVTPFEVIIVDDCSPDNSAEILGGIHGIRLISNTQNQGFIRSCNVGAKAANGQYLYFLNNDTEVTVGWLDELLRTFHEFPGTGLAGSKLMYPNGTLQEAGGIIWQDGTAWNFGRNQDPALPVYNYAREVDYCSGASIMIPKALFEDLKGFDEHYLPAYCEDSDLALKIRNRGHRVIYQPRSVVVHHEGVTSGTDTTQGPKAYQVENSKKLFERWKGRLQHHQANGTNVDGAKDRRAKRRVLVLDHCTPTPNQDAGSVTVFNLLLLLREMDFQVTFIPEDNFLYMPDYTPALQRAGMEVLYAPYYTSVEQHLKDAGERYDLAFLFRPGVVERHLQAIRKHAPKAKVLYHTVDLHYLRMSREADLYADAAKQRAAEEMKKRELAVIRAADASIVHSTTELELLRQELPEKNIHVFPLIMDVRGTEKGYKDRRDVVFVGGYQHTPNVDAVQYFVGEVMPILRRCLPGIRFYVVGSKPPAEILQLASEDVFITGFVKDLPPLLDQMRISVAPLRYGAGIKGKIGTALAVGLPTVATSLAAEGMSLTDGQNILIADGTETFANAVAQIYENESLWNQASRDGIGFAEKAWGAEAAWTTLDFILREIGIDSRRGSNRLSLWNNSFSD